MRKGKTAPNSAVLPRCAALSGVLLALSACGRVRDAPGSTGLLDPGRAEREDGSGGRTGDPSWPAAAPDSGVRVAGGDAGQREPLVCGSSSPLHRLPGSEPCAWTFPDFPGPIAVPERLNVQYEDNVGPRYLLIFPLVANVSECSKYGGCYYDSAGAPTAIIGCPALCEFAGSEDAGLPGQFAAVIDCSGPLPAQ